MENNDFFLTASVSSDTDNSDEYEATKTYNEDNYSGYQNFFLSTNDGTSSTSDPTSTFVVEKQNFDLNDSAFGNENSKLKTADMSKNHIENRSSSDINEDSRCNKIHAGIPSFNTENYYSYSSHKRRMYSNSSSSSDDDDDNDNEQYEKALKYEKIKTTTLDKDVSKHNAYKKRKLDTEDTINNTDEEGYNRLQEVENTDNIFINENRKSDVTHIGKAQRMMKNMGYQPGEGLGKHNQGRVEPVEAVMQHGRRGFGHYVPGLKEASLKWDPQEEEVKVIEDIEWLSNLHSHTPTTEDMADWMKLGLKKQTIDDEVTFCNPEIVKKIISSKTIFDKLDKVEKRKARTRSNPYETIHSAGFLNRAAVKMANINRACNFMFTDPDALDVNELLYFADVCAGPGGFSEYILSRKKWHAKGFGFTLKNENDFRLDEFYAGPCETFHPFYGSAKNGDVFDPKNQEEFRSLIMKHTYGRGVHFMMSDGGFSVEGQENIQEILSKQLYLCQCLIALMIVRPGGHFVTKLFDLFTPFSAGLVYLMYRCFDSICIFKPNSSRPANSERYLICKWKKPDTQAVIGYLSHVNHLLLEKDDNNDIIQLVSLDELEADESFIRYLRNSNDTLGKKQIIGLLKIAAFCEDTTLIETKQADIRKECLKYWEIPDKSRVIPRNVIPQDKIREILNNSTKFLGCEAQKLTKENLKGTILNQPYDWFCMPCSSGPYANEDKAATFYLGLGRTKVYRYVKGTWDTTGDARLELPPNTLVYAELVYEMKWAGRTFIKTYVLHILDSYMLGGEDVSKKYISQRYKLTKKFCDALWKPSPHNYVSVRAKEMYMFGPEIEKKLRISQRRIKNTSTMFEFLKGPLERDSETDEESLYFAPNSVLFLRSVAHPWSRYISKRTNQPYVFNSQNRKTEYEIRRPPEAEANFIQAFETRVIWHWPHDNLLNMDTIVRLIKDPSQNV